MRKCYFVSDLHLFANRSNAHRYLEEIARTASRAEAFVLGGDIFDFRWARIPTHRAVDRAIGWLLELTSACPQCHFHLVLGNHDYHQSLIDRLVELEKQVRNLSWHRYYVRLGSSVFLHGDVADKQMDAPAGGGPGRVARRPAARPVPQRALRRGGAHAAAQIGAALGLLEADRGAANPAVPGEHRPRAAKRRPQRLLRPHAPQALELSLPRADVPQRRAPIKGVKFRILEARR